MWNVPTVDGRPVAVRRNLRRRRARVGVAGGQRAARLLAPAPQAAVALARAGRRLRAADFNPVGVAADLHGRADLLRVGEALTELRVRVPPPAVEAPGRADAAAVSLACRDERPVALGAQLDRLQVIVAGVGVAEAQLSLAVVAPAPDAGVGEQRARELERRAHVDRLRGQRDLARIGARRAIAGCRAGRWRCRPSTRRRRRWPARTCGGCPPRARSMDRPRRSPAPARCRHPRSARRADRRRCRPSSGARRPRPRRRARSRRPAGRPSAARRPAWRRRWDAAPRRCACSRRRRNAIAIAVTATGARRAAHGASSPSVAPSTAPRARATTSPASVASTPRSATPPVEPGARVDRSTRAPAGRPAAAFAAASRFA